jgi:hypothetical protein
MEGVLSDGIVTKVVFPVYGECWTACEVVCCSFLVFITLFAYAVGFVANLVLEISEITASCE